MADNQKTSHASFSDNTNAGMSSSSSSSLSADNSIAGIRTRSSQNPVLNPVPSRASSESHLLLAASSEIASTRSRKHSLSSMPIQTANLTHTPVQQPAISGT